MPPLDNSQMDGYAVRCADVAQAGARLPVAQRIAAGQVGAALAPGTAARIFTGAPVPAGADAIVMQEAVRVDGEHAVFSETPQPGQWIRRAGIDVQRDILKPVIDHIDLVVIRRGEKVIVDIAVQVTGDSAPDTLVALVAQSVQVLAEATNIPEMVEVSVVAR